jgi:hypothetical protein
MPDPISVDRHSQTYGHVRLTVGRRNEACRKMT